MKKIGFIGLGIMGRPMAKNLLKNGYELIVYDLNQEAVADLVANGAQSAATVAEVAESVDTMITMLPNSPQVEAVALGEGGIFDHAKPGSLLIDMSSIAPAAAQKIAASLNRKGIRMIDSPVSGGEPKAIDATLSIMCGGDAADFAEAKPILDCLGASAVHCGSLGAGNARPGFKVDLHIKDLNNALDTAKSVDSPSIMTQEAMKMLQFLHENGEGQSDHSAIAHYYEKLAGVEIRPKA